LKLQDGKGGGEGRTILRPPEIGTQNLDVLGKCDRGGKQESGGSGRRGIFPENEEKEGEVLVKIGGKKPKAIGQGDPGEQSARRCSSPNNELGRGG